LGSVKPNRDEAAGMAVLADLDLSTLASSSPAWESARPVDAAAMSRARNRRYVYLNYSYLDFLETYL
jgi:hypothetical protein